MAQTREIIVRPKPGEDIRGDFARFLSLASERDWTRLKVLFGFAWGNYAYKADWIEEVMSPTELKERVDALEENGDGAIGDDDLFVSIEGLGIQFTFCHENDIHIEGSPHAPLLVSELDRYRDLGWEIHERTKN
ncbi:hypothetical protein [Haloferula sp.]|uniref:hypothetical protein n=1 Tax=Haloferula sp. TaxID=2497595 RepID=UPI0032A0437E